LFTNSEFHMLSSEVVCFIVPSLLTIAKSVPDRKSLPTETMVLNFVEQCYSIVLR